MYLYIFVMVASESLKATGSGEGSRSVYMYTSRAKPMEMEEALHHQQHMVYVYSRDRHPSEVVNTTMRNAKNLDAMFLIRRPGASGYQDVLYSAPVR